MEYKLKLSDEMLSRGLLSKYGDDNLSSFRCTFSSRTYLEKITASSMKRSPSSSETLPKLLLEICKQGSNPDFADDEILDRGLHVASSDELWDFFMNVMEGKVRRPDFAEIQPAVLTALKHLKNHGDLDRISRVKEPILDAARKLLVSPEIGEDATTAFYVIQELEMKKEEWLKVMRAILSGRGKELGPVRQLMQNALLTYIGRQGATEALLGWTADKDRNLRSGASLLLDALG